MLLTEAGYRFTVNAPPDSVEAAVSIEGGPEKIVGALSYAKADHIAGKTEHGLVLAADTIAWCDDRVLGKPESREHAREILECMSGREHLVLTGVTLWLRPENFFQTHVETTILVMKKLDPVWLEGYLESGQWRGKAGAFGYQDGIDWVRITEGSESNVVGLPVEKLDGWIEALMNRQN